MTNIEAALRGGAIALFVLFAIVAWRDGRRFAVARYSGLFALCAIAYAIESAPAFARECPAWLVPLRLLSISGPAVFYLWSSAHFDDAFTPSWRHWLPWFGMVALGAWALASDQWIAWRMAQIAALVLVAIGGWRAMAGRSGDLVEGRRRLRLFLAIGAGLFIAGLNLLAVVVHGNANLAAGTAGPAALAALALASCLLGLGGRAGTGPLPIVPAEAAPREAAPARGAATADPEEGRLLARLQALMDTERIYRAEGLGIAALAARLGIPEYRLRRLINQRLGHRNFTSFVNGYRLTEAIAALADPDQAAVPILTIALDAGFQSIGPFNRAFKAHTGMTPSEFRRDRLASSQARAAE